MNSLTDLKIAVVDGQQIFLPTALQFDALMEGEEVDGMPPFSPSSKNSLGRIRKEVSLSDELVLGIYRASKFQNFLTPIVLLSLSDRFQRVLTEKVSCTHCDWSGLIANPSDHSLYFGTENEFESLRTGHESATKTCPKCGGVLPRPAAWVQPLNLAT